MRLIAIELEGFRRFRSRQKMTIDEKLTCILGPNEVGKTSLLNALSRFGGQKPFLKEGPGQDVSRGLEFDDDHLIMSALFEIEKEDIKNFSSIPGIRTLRFFRVTKKINGLEDFAIIPEIKKPNAFPEKLGMELFDLSKQPEWLAQCIQQDSDLSSLYEEMRTHQDSNEDPEIKYNIDKSKLEKILNVTSKVHSKEAEKLSSEIRLLLVIYKNKDVNDAILKHLTKIRPILMLFSPSQLHLQSDYNLAVYFPEKGQKVEKIPQALSNFESLSGLSLKMAHHYSKIDDIGQLKSLLDEANENLKMRVAQNWNQDKLQVEANVTNRRLSIIVKSEGSKFERLAERSEGLRQFIALMSFLHSGHVKDREAILLVDEIERHLHYDAQADLIQMLAKQRIARQVIYTTHSIGCLPEDLGNGVRVLRLDEDSAGSIIENNFWSQNKPGLSPLIVGMGAATMAFLPTRSCVLTEGPADFLLYPSLFRDATKQNPLGFQFSPGLSVATPEQIKIMQADGQVVLHLVDGDEGGKDLRKKLKRAGIDESRIFDLSQLGKEGLQLEDLIVPKVLSKAINSELERSGIESRIKESDLPEKNRWSFLEKNLQKENTKNLPSKVTIAYRLLELRSELNILDKKYERGLKEIYENMVREIKV